MFFLLTLSSQGRNVRGGQGRSQGQGCGCGRIQAQPQTTQNWGRRNNNDLILEATRLYQTNAHPRDHYIISSWDNELKQQATDNELELNEWQDLIPDLDTKG